MRISNTLLTLHDPALARHYYDLGVWRDESFYRLAANHAKAHGDTAAVRDANRRLSYRELIDWADGTAAALAEAGLGRGDRVQPGRSRFRRERRLRLREPTLLSKIPVQKPLQKPVKIQEVSLVVERCIEMASLRREVGYLRRVQREDLVVCGAMTDPKGDRRKAPHEQPDAYMRIVERRPDGGARFDEEIHPQML